MMQENGCPQMFIEGTLYNTRYPMVIRIDGKWFCYNTAWSGSRWVALCRTSDDFKQWSRSVLVAEHGQTGYGLSKAECPFVVKHDSGYFFLLRAQVYGENAKTSLYASKEPFNFGIDDDSKLVCTLPIADPEIVVHDGRYFIACQLPGLDGIQIARLEWKTQSTAAAPEVGRG